MSACAGGFGALEGHEALALAGDDELGVVDEAHAVLGGEALGASADEVDVRGFVEDEAGGLDGVAQALDAGDAAGAEVGAVHEQGVELDAAVAGEEGAAAGVEGVVVFHDGDGGFDGVDGGAAAREAAQPAARALAMPRSWAATASSGMAQAPPWMRRMGWASGERLGWH